MASVVDEPVDSEDEPVTTWGELHRLAAERLSSAAEARWIVERAAGDPFHVVESRPVSVRSHHHWRLMVERRESGMPIQYAMERWAFRTLELLVDARVLIPRPETEVVAGAALDEHVRVGGPVVDLGTGSGAIALSFAAERPGTEVWAVDASADAVAVARANCTGLGRRAATVRIVEGSWFEPLPEALRGGVGVIVSNPPYVPDDAPLPAVVADWEPASALRSGVDGLDDLRTIVVEARDWLAPGGALVVEHGDDQGAAVRDLATAAGYSEVRTGTDLTGRDRYLVARR